MFLLLISYFRNGNFSPILQKDELTTNKKTKCPNPGTFVNGTGGCECSAETPFGDPYSTIGCWNCNPQCDLNAQCVAKNKCICNEGFIGDGIDFCEKPVPKLLKTTPKEGTVLGGTVVDFIISVDAVNYTVVKAYCRFGPVITDAIQINTTNIKCLTPQSREGTVLASVSFDAVKWSTQKSEFTYKKYETSNFVVFFYSFLILMLSLIATMSAWIMHKKKQFGENPDEILPLNKWHMNAPRINPQTEKSGLDFIWNIMID